MGEGAADTAAVEIDDVAVLPAGKDHTAAEGVAALRIDEAGGEQQIERIVLAKMAAQVSAGSIANAQFFHEGGLAQPALLEVVDRFGMAVELELVEGGRCFQHGPVVGCGDLPLEEVESLPEGEMLRQFDEADEVAALAPWQ